MELDCNIVCSTLPSRASLKTFLQSYISRSFVFQAPPSFKLYLSPAIFISSCQGVAAWRVALIPNSSPPGSLPRDVSRYIYTPALPLFVSSSCSPSSLKNYRKPRWETWKGKINFNKTPKRETLTLNLKNVLVYPSRGGAEGGFSKRPDIVDSRHLELPIKFRFPVTQVQTHWIWTGKFTCGFYPWNVSQRATFRLTSNFNMYHWLISNRRDICTLVWALSYRKFIQW